MMLERCPTCDRLVEVRHDGCFATHDIDPWLRQVCNGSNDRAWTGRPPVFTTTEEADAWLDAQ